MRERGVCSDKKISEERKEAGSGWVGVKHGLETEPKKYNMIAVAVRCSLNHTNEKDNVVTSSSQDHVMSSPNTQTPF